MSSGTASCWFAYLKHGFGVKARADKSLATVLICSRTAYFDLERPNEGKYVGCSPGQRESVVRSKVHIQNEIDDVGPKESLQDKVHTVISFRVPPSSRRSGPVGG